MRSFPHYLILIALMASAVAGTPSETAKAFVKAINASDYDQAAKSYDPDGLREFRSMFKFMDRISELSAKSFYKSIFIGHDSRESINKLSDEEFLSAILLWSANGPGMGPMGLNFSKAEVLGEVFEGENRAHVLARVSYPSHSESDPELRDYMEVISLKKGAGGWKIRPSARMKGMALNLRRGYEP